MKSDVTTVDKDSGEKSPPLINSLRDAIGLESAAEKALQAARERRETQEAAQRTWHSLVAEIDRQQQAVQRAADRVQSLKNSSARFQEYLNQTIGDPDPANPIGIAENLYTELGALPLITQAARLLREKFWARVTEVCEQGKRLGVPPSGLKTLPSRPARDGGD